MTTVNFLNKLNKLNKIEWDNKKVLVVILICLIIIYIDFSFLIKSQRQAITSVGEKTIKLKQDIDALTKDLATMQQAQTKQEVALKVKKIISEEQMPMLFQEISNIANKNNIKIMEMIPSKESKAKEEKALVAPKTPLAFITLDLFGGYHNLGRFINDLENAEILMAVENLKIVPQQNDYFKHGITLILKTYVKK